MIVHRIQQSHYNIMGKVGALLGMHIAAWLSWTSLALVWARRRRLPAAQDRLGVLATACREAELKSFEVQALIIETLCICFRPPRRTS